MTRQTHTYEIANVTAPVFRSRLNEILTAIRTLNAGGGDPSQAEGMIANFLFIDSTANTLNIRNADNDANIILAKLDQTNDRIEIITDDIQYASSSVTEVKNTSGTTVLSLQVPTQSTAETGTENTQVMTPLRTKQSVQANAITSVTAGTNMSVSTSSGAVTVTNGLSAGSGITISSGSIKLTTLHGNNATGGVAVGSYILGVSNPKATRNQNSTISGSNLAYAGLDFPPDASMTQDNARILRHSGQTLSGTWRYHSRSDLSNHHAWGLYQRIS